MNMMEGAVLPNPIECLGKGFDLTSDFRLKFAKGSGRRLVVVDEGNKRDITVPGTGGGGGATIPNVSEDIRCDKGDRLRFKSDVLQFNQVYLLNCLLLSLILVYINFQYDFEYIYVWSYAEIDVSYITSILHIIKA